MFGKRRVYLDYAAGVAGNPSSPHAEGRAAKEMLEEARVKIARLTEVQADDIIFTSGATEANALAILGHVRALLSEGQKDIHILYLPSAHASLVLNAKLLEKEGVTVEALPVKDWRVDIEALKKMIRKETALITMEAVCGETGVVWNTREVGNVLNEFRTGELKKESAQAARHRIVVPEGVPIQYSFFNSPVLHVDASQAPHTEKITRAHFGADMLTFDASKVSSVRGIGALIAHRTIPLVPLFKGGGQERGLRSGSEAPELAKSFAAALDAAATKRESFTQAALTERNKLKEDVTSRIQGAVINEGRSQVPHILNISLPGRDTDYLLALLDEAGFAASSRSACETDSEDGSRAVFVLTNDRERARTTLRVSWDADTKSAELQRFMKVLQDSIQFIDSNVSR